MAAAVNTLEIALRGAYDFDRLERAIRDLQPLLRISEPTRVHLDLSGTVFLGPTVIALLEAALRRLEEEDLLIAGGAIALPRNPLTCRYLQRMDLFRGLATVGEIPEDFQRRDPKGFRPCQQFESTDDYIKVARDLTAALVEKCQTDSVARSAILICLNELTENVIHHAYTPLGGFAACQGVPKRKRFEVGIVDLGVGIRGSLAKNQLYADIEDDVTAIETALQPRVTSTPDRNSGIGLSITKLLLKDNGGSLLVRSGTGRVVGGSEDVAEQMSVELMGTVVAMRARTDRPLDIGKVYERLPRDDSALDDD